MWTADATTSNFSPSVGKLQLQAISAANVRVDTYDKLIRGSIGDKELGVVETHWASWRSQDMAHGRPAGCTLAHTF
jgi:hypothetical protein